ncbi:MAG: protein phosphatase 2C domain-containing protein [Myxococcales bacterium]|nr:protein phosphatase 2C domain-containing protein [Myxococcales bacterium]
MDHSWGYGTEQRLREENQDCHGVFELPDYTLAIVCDGMGGHVGGAQASSLAVRTIHDTLMELQGRPILQSIEEAIERTNLVIYEAARKNHRLMGMGTTVVVAAITSDACYVAHVGDSRLYLVRSGEVQQLTRDHTMVNLFVDAELLSPEDAATHPEAHVLSRSLGVERQVEVDLASPIQLQQGDVLFLCSDGVHGVVTDWELANVDWGTPHAAVAHVLSIVNTREGDDNASSVAVLMGTSFEDVPPTPLPEPRRFDDMAAPTGGVTAVPAEEILDHGHTQGSADAGYLVYDEQPAPQAMPAEVRPPADMVVAPPPPPPPPQAHHQQQVRPGPTPPPPPALKPPQRKRRRSRLLALVPVAAASMMLLLALLGAFYLLFPGSDGADPEELATLAPVVPKLDITGPGEQPGAFDPEEVDVGLSDSPEVDPEKPLFQPELPPPPRRLPHRPTQYTQPPPGGQIQFQAVNAARRRDCPMAMDAVQLGMRTVSPDHATLYKGAWLCFNEAHQRKLEQTVAMGWVEFQYQLPHFEGTPEEKQSAVENNSELGRLPAWYRPAVGGLEYRLEMFTADEEMEEVLADLFSEQHVADHLAKDVHMEAFAAEGLSRIPPKERTPSIVDAWARRVFVTAWALQNRPGRLLDKHRKELMPVLRGLLDQASSNRLGPNGELWKVPAVVVQAKEVAEGNRPPPTPTRRPKPKRDLTAEEIERQLKEGQDGGEVLIHRN